ncbi:MAG: general secretion pathway protein GspB [Woeseiaceae bacterium]
MSFILDALRKSENERQQQADAEFATVPSSPDAPKAPRWLWVLAVLLALNVAVLIGIAMRPDAPAVVTPATPASVDTAATDVAATATDSFSDRVAEARRNQPEPITRTSVESEPPVVSTELRTGVSPVSTDSIPQSERAVLPTLDELRVNGTLMLPDLHVDVHVYSDVPSERFVYINMNKYRENQALDEGPVITEITNDGVILNHRGTAFILPRR